MHGVDAKHVVRKTKMGIAVGLAALALCGAAQAGTEPVSAHSPTIGGYETNEVDGKPAADGDGASAAVVPGGSVRDALRSAISALGEEIRHTVRMLCQTVGTGAAR